MTTCITPKENMIKTLKTLIVITGLAIAGMAIAQEAPDVLVKRITQEVMDAAKSEKDIRSGNRKRIQQQGWKVYDVNVLGA